MISDPLLNVARESIQSWIDKAISEHSKWQPDSGLDNHWYANQHRAWMVHHGMWFSDATLLLTNSDTRGSFHS